MPIESFVGRKVGRVAYYTRGVLRDLLPYPIQAYRLRRLYRTLEATGLDPHLLERVHYYNRVEPGAVLRDGVRAGSVSNEGSYYLYDLREHLNYFSRDLMVDYEFGDVTFHLNSPGFVKSRPISVSDRNSVVLKLDKLRHFNWPRDGYGFSDKMKAVVWRGAMHSELRKILVNKFHHHPRHDIGHITKAYDSVAPKPWLSSADQFRYRYMLSIESVDVATNLKMVLSSQSLCLMPRPRYESWLMEGKLVDGIHYVGLRDDFADLDEKVEYYDRHESEALAIIANANRFMEQFADPNTERLISILVMQKYFENTGQLPPQPALRLSR